MYIWEAHLCQKTLCGLFVAVLQTLVRRNNILPEKNNFYLTKQTKFGFDFYNRHPLMHVCTSILVQNSYSLKRERGRESARERERERGEKQILLEKKMQ
jgi:hypothetical protein